MPILEPAARRSSGLLCTSSILRSIFHPEAQPSPDELGGRAGRAMALEHPYDIYAALEAGALDRRVSMTLRPVDIGAPGEEQLDHGDAVLLYCDHQWCCASLVAHVFEDSALVQQQFCDRHAAGIGGRMKRRKAPRVARHHVGALAE